MSNPSVAKGFIQIYTDDISGVPGRHDAGTTFHKAPLPAVRVPPEKEIQWSQVRGARGPGYWASMSNPSVAKDFIQILADDNKAVCWGTIMLEPHFMMNFLRHHFQQLGLGLLVIC
jgi:hypothetical protein